MKPFEANIEKRMLGCQALLPRAIFPIILVLIPHRQMGHYLLGTGKATAQHICKMSYRLMLDTYQQADYSLRPTTACCTNSWCWSVVVMYVEKYYLAGAETLAESPACRMNTMKTLATKTVNTIPLQRYPETYVPSQYLELSLPKMKYFSTYQHVLPIGFPIRGDTWDSSNFFLKGLV